MHLNVYEFDIGNDVDYENMIVPDAQLYKTFLFECQLAIFMIDIQSTDSFTAVQELIPLLNNIDYPYLTKLFVSNKIDQEASKNVSKFEIDEFVKNNNMEYIEISVLNGTGIEELCSKIDRHVNKTTNQLPINLVLESNCSKISSLNFQSSISLIIIGDSEVGKTCIFTRYFKNSFTEKRLSTIGVDKEIKAIKINNTLCKLCVWDTAGQERFQSSLPKNYYQNADGILLLFDVTEGLPNQSNNSLESSNKSLESFNHVSKWIEKIQENTGRFNNNTSKTQTKESEGAKEDVIVYLIGNKIDKKNRVVSYEDASNLAKSYGIKYFEISCKTNMNIHEVMSSMILECYKKGKMINGNFSLDKSKQRNRVACCGGSKK